MPDFAGLYGASLLEKPAETASASASGPAEAGMSPAFFFLTVVIILVLIRLAYESAS